MQNGLLALGAFYALANGVNGWLVFLFCCLLWGSEEVRNKKGN